MINLKILNTTGDIADETGRILARAISSCLKISADSWGL